MQFRFSARGICFTTLLNPVNEAQTVLCDVTKVKIYQFDDAENSNLLLSLFNAAGITAIRAQNTHQEYLLNN